MKTLKEIVQEASAQAMLSSGLNQSVAAATLGITRNTLRTHLTNYVSTVETTGSLNSKVLAKATSSK